MSQFQQLDQLMERQDGMLRTGQALAAGISKPVFYQFEQSLSLIHISFTAEWQISGKNAVGQRDVAAYTTYGTGRANAYNCLLYTSRCV